MGELELGEALFPEPAGVSTAHLPARPAAPSRIWTEAGPPRHKKPGGHGSVLCGAGPTGLTGGQSGHLPVASCSCGPVMPLSPGGSRLLILGGEGSSCGS